jgi:hypothetical protein
LGSESRCQVQHLVVALGAAFDAVAYFDHAEGAAVVAKQG